MATAAIKSIADAVTAGFQILKKTLDTKEVNRLKAAVEAAEEYIHAKECFGKYKDMTAEKRLKVCTKERKRFFHYNQG